jgi:hypothetical protein
VRARSAVKRATHVATRPSVTLAEGEAGCRARAPGDLRGQARPAFGLSADPSAASQSARFARCWPSRDGFRPRPSCQQARSDRGAFERFKALRRPQSSCAGPSIGDRFLEFCQTPIGDGGGEGVNTLIKSQYPQLPRHTSTRCFVLCSLARDEHTKHETCATVPGPRHRTGRQTPRCPSRIVAWAPGLASGQQPSRAGHQPKWTPDPERTEGAGRLTRNKSRRRGGSLLQMMPGRRRGSEGVAGPID